MNIIVPNVGEWTIMQCTVAIKKTQQAPLELTCIVSEAYETHILKAW